MEVAKQLKERAVALLHKQNVVTDQLAWLERKTGLPREVITLVAFCLFGIYLLFGNGASLLCNMVGFLYPTYFSIKAIESPNKEDDTQWLIYWVVYGFFSIIEPFSDILLFWFPFYYASKCFFLIWCMAPVTWNGSEVMYRRVIHPFFTRHADTISSVVSDLTTTAKTISETVKTDAISRALQHEKNQ